MLFPLLLCSHSLKKSVISSRQAVCICLVFATGQKRSSGAVLLNPWKGHSQYVGNEGLPSPCGKQRWSMFPAFILQTLIYREQRTKLHLMRIISFAQEDSRDYLQGTSRMLVSPQPCSSWSFERPCSACSPQFPLLCFPLFVVCWHFAFPSRTVFAYFLFSLICKCFCL